MLPGMKRPLGMIVVAILMIVFGITEIATGFTHNFLGLISATSATLATYVAASIGALYAIGGLLLLPMKKRSARLTLVCLALVVGGRILLVVGGLYPTDTFLQTFSIIVGTAIAVIFAAYIGLRWSLFR
jgi:surface polysaccharide O-acyltransferase-like enzyme